MTAVPTRARAGLDLLKDFGNVNLSVGLTPEELKHAVQSSDALIIRSATKVSRIEAAGHAARLPVQTYWQQA